MPAVASEPDRRSVSELTRAVFGESMTIERALKHLMREEFAPGEEEAVDPASLWVGSVGYERYRHSEDFARLLAGAGVERLIDVRELPISRRKGYAKTALSEAMEAVGIEYVHMRELGNPKELRDLYKSGRVEEGRDRYREHLLAAQRPALEDLHKKLGEKRCALMCLEHDPACCHRSVIIEALGSELGLELDVAAIG